MHSEFLSQKTSRQNKNDVVIRFEVWQNNPYAWILMWRRLPLMASRDFGICDVHCLEESDMGGRKNLRQGSLVVNLLAEYRPFNWLRVRFAY